MRSLNNTKRSITSVAFLTTATAAAGAHSQVDPKLETTEGHVIVRLQSAQPPAPSDAPARDMHAPTRLRVRVPGG